MKNKTDLDPKTDWVFKLMFTRGEKGNRALIDFLNAFLEPMYGSKIRKAELLNTDLTKRRENHPNYFLDLLIKTDTGLLVNLEMQQFNKAYFIRRSQAYLLSAASRYLGFYDADDAQITKVLSFSVCNFKLKPDEHDIHLPKNSLIQFLYLELPLVNEYTKDKRVEDYNAAECWARFLAYTTEDRKNGVIKKLCEREEGIKMAEEILMTVTEKERQIAMELSQWKYEFTVNAEKAIAREEGHTEGLAEGRAEGLAEGREEGLEKGLKQGLEKGLEKGRAEGIALGEARGLQLGTYQSKLETAKAFKEMGIPISQIAKGTGLSEEEIEKL